MLDGASEAETSLLSHDVDIVATRGSGPGGQNRNKVASCIVATHRPSGIVVRIDSERSQHANKKIALTILGAKIAELERSRISAERASVRKAQVGSGMRGDKIRTYRVGDDAVLDHRSGKRWRLSDWVRGIW